MGKGTFLLTKTTIPERETHHKRQDEGGKMKGIRVKLPRSCKQGQEQRLYVEKLWICRTLRASRVRLALGFAAILCEGFGATAVCNRSFVLSLAFIPALLVQPPASAEIVCQRDFLNRTVCTDRDNGESTTIKRDYLGRDVITGPDGHRQTCKTDYLGRYVCR